MAPATASSASATCLDTKVRDFFAQKRIAVAGVSRQKKHHPAGDLIYRRFKASGHEVFAINPHMETFEGERCYPDVGSIPGGVDAVVIITGPESTNRIVRDCGEAGVRHVWMHNQMGKTVGKNSSVSTQAVDYCRERGINVIAGACPMMFGPGADIGHTCIRWYLKWTGALPS